MTIYIALEVRGATRADRPPPVGSIVVDGREVAVAALARRPWPANLGLVVGGLIGLVLGAAWLVDGATGIALWLGVPETVVGLTIVAIGTSAPEIATSIVATIRGEREIAVGNAVGSNIFNLALVLGLTAVVSPKALPIDAATLGPDLLVMLGAAIACWPAFRSGMELTRSEAASFLLVYLGYLAWIVLTALGSPVAWVAGATTLVVGIGTVTWLSVGALRERIW
jgi:cation:H+ antiporter